jgi:peroxiredoxin (alkyl hydroperoxide reductase subunit C)
MTLKVGDPAPDFKLPAVTGETQGEFQLSSHRGRNVIVLFYVLDFTPVCAVELPPFQAELAKLTELNAAVVGICTDTVFSHIAFQKSLGGLSFPLASDRWPYAEVAKAYGLFPATRHPFGGTNDRAVFIVDKEGKIAWAKVYDIGEAPKISDFLDELKKLG